MNVSNSQGLTLEKLQFFIAGLSGLPESEVRKAKLLFLKNEISQLKAIKSSLAGFRVAQGCFAIIPIFWPILWAQRKGMNAALDYQIEQIRNALSVWKEDLGSDAHEMENELRMISE